MFLNKCFHFWDKTLSHLDMFKDPVHLNLRGNTKLSSSVGGTITVLIFIFLGYQAISQTVQMLNRNSPQVIQINEFQSNPGPIYMNQSDPFIFSISTRVGNTFVNMSEMSLISFTATYYQHNYSATGDLLQFYYQILWAPCNRSNFPTDVFPQDTFDTFFLNYAYCPTGIYFGNPLTGACPEEVSRHYPDCFTPPNFRIQGILFSPRYELVDFQIKLCDQNDAFLLHGLKCAPNPANEMLTFPNVTVYIGFSNTYIDSANYNVPNRTFFDYMGWIVHPNLSKTADIFVDTEIVRDSDSFLFPSSQRQQSFYSISPDKMREQQIASRTHLLDVMFQRSRLSRVTIRTYVKILDVIASVGGLSELFIFVGAIIVIGYARHKYHMVLSNEIYNFDPPEQKLPVALKQVSRNNLEESVSEKFMPRDLSFSKLYIKKELQEKKEPAENLDLRKKRKKLEISVWQYYKSMIFRCCKKRSHEEKLTQRATLAVMKDLDIINIVKKLKEIDRLKSLLLSPNQIEALKLINKPIITLKHGEPVFEEHLRHGKLQQNSETPSSRPDLFLSDYEKLYAVYRKIKEDENLENFKMNEKILSMIGEDTVKMFKQVEKTNKFIKGGNKFQKITGVPQDESLDFSGINCCAIRLNARNSEEPS